MTSFLNHEQAEFILLTCIPIVIMTQMPALQAETGAIAIFLQVVLSIFILFPGPLVLFYFGRMLHKSMRGYNSRELKEDDELEREMERAVEGPIFNGLNGTAGHGVNVTNGFGMEDDSAKEDSVMEDSLQVEMAEILDVVTEMWKGDTEEVGDGARTVSQHSTQSYF